MSNWKQTLRIDDVWRKRNGECGPEAWTDKTVHELAKEIARRIRRKWPEFMDDGNNPDPDLMDIHDWLLSIPDQKERERVLALYRCDPCMEEDYEDLLHETPLREFNSVMSIFYDWCDRNLVWVEK